MPKMNFTNANLRAYFDKNPKATVYDIGQRGCAAYRTSSGHISLMAHYRIGHRGVKAVIGRLGELSLADFRAKVATLVVAGKENVDVVGDRKREAEKAVTLGEVFELHKESMIRRKCSPASVAVNEGVWRTRLGKHASRPLSSISKADVKAWHQQWRHAGPCAANRAIRLLSVLWNFAANKTDAELGSNPCRAVDPWPERAKRDVLPFEHLAEWWQQVDALPNPSHRAYWKLLLFSSLRRMDAASIKLEDIHENFIVRGNPKGGSKKAFQCPLTPQLRAIVDEALAAKALMHPRSEYLFPSTGELGFMRGMWHSQVNVAGILVSPHVLRRTYISAGASVGVNFIVLKALANHVGNGSDVTLTSYIKVPFEDRMIGACKIADFLETKIRGALPAPVKQLTFMPPLQVEEVA